MRKSPAGTHASTQKIKATARLYASEAQHCKAQLQHMQLLCKTATLWLEPSGHELLWCRRHRVTSNSPQRFQHVLPAGLHDMSSTPADKNTLTKAAAAWLHPYTEQEKESINMWGFPWTYFVQSPWQRHLATQPITAGANAMRCTTCQGVSASAAKTQQHDAPVQAKPDTCRPS